MATTEKLLMNIELIFILNNEEHYLIRFITFNEDNTWNLPLNISPKDKPYVFITYDMSTFNSNSSKCQHWVKNGDQKLRLK